MNISYIYGFTTILALLLACGYCVLVKKKEIWLVWLYFSVFIANIGYLALSISTSLQEALLANRLAYLGCICLPLFMLMIIVKVCGYRCSRVVAGILITVSVVVFLIVASQGYFNYYYSSVELVFVNGAAKLIKEYGPLHKVYYVYLFSYMLIMSGVIIVAYIKKNIASFKHACLLLIVVYFNIAIWFVEQFINYDFEFLSISYIASELLLLLLYWMIQDYELVMENGEDIIVTEESYILPKQSFDEVFPEINKLSEREREVFEKILQNKKRKEIAEELFITENTVKKHTSSIFSKLEVSNRSELFEKIIQKQN